MKLVLFFFISSLSIHAWEIPKQCRQLIVGSTKTWNSTHVQLNWYEKIDGKWKQLGNRFAGRIGRNGLAWGRGIHPHQTKPYLKREGDGRAPAGVFEIGQAYGSHVKVKKNANLRYTRVTTRDLWVEDSKSPLYNRHVRINHEPKTAWELKSQMRQNDYPHSLKLFICHNKATEKINAKPYAGSAIFFHIWRNKGKSATAGCTTISEFHLLQLIDKIDPKKMPLYVLLPSNELRLRRESWDLPQE